MHKYLMIALGALAALPALAEDAPQFEGPFVEVSDVHVSPPLRLIPPAPHPQVDGPRDHRRPPARIQPGPDWVDSDRSVDPLADIGVNGLSRTPSPLLSFQGLSNECGCSPPDTVGAVGENHYVQMVNATRLAVFNKTTGAQIGSTINLNQLWTGSGDATCSATSDGDPVVVYDYLANRFVLAQFFSNGICVAVSQNSDPTGSYNLYRFNTPEFPDYYKIGAWSDAYYVSANENTYSALALNRTAMLAGTPATSIRFSGQTNLLMPATVVGTTPPPAGTPGIFYTFKDNSFHGGVDRLEMFHFVANFATPASSSFSLAQSLPITAYTYTVCGFFVLNCIPQGGTAQRVDPVSEWPMWQLQYRNFAGGERLVANFTVDVGSDRAGIRWYELSKTGASSYAILQESTYAPADGLHRWMGSIAMDRSGGIALGYSASSGSAVPSVRYATRLPTDPVNTLQTEVVMHTGGGSQTGSNRWGDYSALTVDPVDGCTFWFTNEYYTANSGNNWTTRIGKFVMPECLAPAATQLAFGVQPSNAVTGAAIAPAVTVRILDAGGNLVDSSAAVSVALGANPGGATLAGITSVNAINGVATFNSLALNNPGTGYTLVATSSGLASATSNPFNVCANAIVVANADDAGAGSLRQAIADICANGTITFDPGFFGVPRTITLTSGDLQPARNMTIQGPGAGLLTVSGNNATRVFSPVGVQFTVSGMRLTAGNGSSTLGNGFGAALRISGGALTLRDLVVSGNACGGTSGGISVAFATLTMERTTISGNTCGNVGALYFQDSTGSISDSTISGNAGSDAIRLNASSANSGLTLTNVTLSGNTAPAGPSALLSQGAAGRTATFTLVNSTVSGNSSSAAGASSAAIVQASGPTHVTTLSNTIVSGNTAGGAPADVAGTLAAASSFNLIGVGGGLSNGVNGNQVGINDPLLAPLGGYGGATQTRPPLPGSLAIDSGTASGAPAADQRGVARPQLGAFDVGAVESRGFTLVASSGGGQSTPVLSAFAAPLVVGVTPIAAGEPVNGGRVQFTPPGAGASAALAPNPATIAGGNASTTATANGTVGSYNVTAAARGGAPTVSFALTNTAQATTTTITADAPDPTVVGEPYLVSVRVSGSATSPTGSVNVRDGAPGSPNCTIALTVDASPNSIGSCSLTSTSAGAKTLTADYTPTGDFLPSSGSAAHQVNPAATSISVSGPARSRINTPTGFSFVLGVLAPGAGSPAGTVTLSSGSASCQVTVPTASPSCALSFDTLGPRTVSAAFAPSNGNFLASASSGAGNAQTLVYALADLSVTKSDGVGTYAPDDLIVYSVDVGNLGPDTAANIRVVDLVPAGLIDVVWSCDASGGASCPQAGGSGNLDALVASIPPGGLLGYTFYGNVDGAPLQVSNTATLQLPADTTIEDPLLANNSATDTNLLDRLFRNGFEDATVNSASGSARMPALASLQTLDGVARIVFVLDDVDGEAARVYVRMFDGRLQYALALRGSAGRLRPAAWLEHAREPTLHWTATPTALGWRLQQADLR